MQYHYDCRAQIDQRYYASTYGRFLTPDQYAASGAAKGNVNNPGDPGSWNRYAYTRGDPVNRYDPRGLNDDEPDVGDLTPFQDLFADADSQCAQIINSFDSGGIDASYDPCFTAGRASSYASWTPPEIPCSQLLTDAIGAFLTRKHSPLAADSAEIVQVAQQDNLDPTLIAAMAIAENGSATNNPFSLGPNGRNTYPTLDAAISAVGQTLDKYIYQRNETTVSALWSGNIWITDPRKPWVTIQWPGYCVGTTATDVAGCQNTGNTIAGFMKSIGASATVGG